jgi:hypothetical protein
VIVLKNVVIKSLPKMTDSNLPSASDSILFSLRRLVDGVLPLQLGSDHVGLVVDKVALGQVFSKYFDFPCQFSFHRLLQTHHLSSGAGTIDQLVADVPSGVSLTPPQETKKQN